MKRIVVLLLSVLIGSSAWANIVMSNSEVSQYWRSKSIKVTDGGATPDVMTLLKAFHQTLPTWVVGEVMKREAQPAKGSMYHVVPEAGKPWTEKDVVVYTSDFEHVHYYVVLQNGSIGYIITSEPNYDEEEGRVMEYASHKNGYGAKDESIDIIHADRGEDIFIKPQWKPFSFIEREE